MRSSCRRPLWRRPDFLKLWLGQTISQFGAQVMLLALGLTAAVLLNASALEMGILGAVKMAPFLIFGLPAGVWVDHRSRRPVMITSDLARALVLTTIPVAYLLGALTMTQLYVAGFVVGIFTVFFDISYQAYLPRLVARDQLVDGNSKLEASRAGAQVAGPGLAGLLVQMLSAPVAVLFNVATFVASATLIWRIGTPEPVPVPPVEGRGVWGEVGEGLRYVLAHPLLRPIACATATCNLFNSAIWAAYILFAVHDLGLDAGTIGLVSALGNVGFLIGAFSARPLAQTLGLGAALIAGSLVWGSGGILISMATPATAIPMLILVWALWGMGNPVYNINQVSLRQMITPDRLQGRMNATMKFLIMGALPIGSLLGGFLGEWLGLRQALFLAGIGQALSFLWVLISPIRSLRRQPAAAEA